jgi:hypothetical protein
MAHGEVRGIRLVVGWIRFEVAGALIAIRERVGRLFRGQADQAEGPGPERYIPAFDPRLPSGSATYGPPDESERKET